jgi:hypothetical protein
VLLRVVRGHEADVGEVAVAFGVIHAVADDEEVGDGEADVIGLDFFEAAGGLVEESGDSQGLGVVLEEDLAQVRQCKTGVEDVFNDEDVFAFDGLVEILDEFDCSGRALAFAVAGDGDEVECGVDLNVAREVGEKRGGAFEDSDHDELFTCEVVGDLRAHFGDALGDLLAGVEDLKVLICDGSHAEEYRLLSGAGRKGSCVNLPPAVGQMLAGGSHGLTASLPTR